MKPPRIIFKSDFISSHTYGISGPAFSFFIFLLFVASFFLVTHNVIIVLTKYGSDGVDSFKKHTDEQIFSCATNNHTHQCYDSVYRNVVSYTNDGMKYPINFSILIFWVLFWIAVGLSYLTIVGFGFGVFDKQDHEIYQRTYVLRKSSYEDDDKNHVNLYVPIAYILLASAVVSVCFMTKPAISTQYSVGFYDTCQKIVMFNSTTLTSKEYKNNLDLYCTKFQKSLNLYHDNAQFRDQINHMRIISWIFVTMMIGNVHGWIWPLGFIYWVSYTIMYWSKNFGKKEDNNDKFHDFDEENV